MSRKGSKSGTITQRPNGLYQARIQINGVRRAVYGRTEREVAAKLDALRCQIVLTGNLPNPGSRTVNDLLDAWFTATKSTLRPTTAHYNKAICARHVRPAIGAIRLSRLDTFHVQKLYADLQARNLSRIPSTVHAMLHKAFRLAVLWRWLPENPCDRVVKPAYKARRKEVWHESQLRTFINGTGDHWLGPLWVFLVSTGCRLGEALALTWENVGDGSAKIDRNLQRVGGEWFVWEPKTKAGRRTVSLPEPALRALKRQRARQAEWRLAAGESWKATGLVFTTTEGTPVHRSTVSHVLAKLCKRLALPPINPHGFRHLHASYLIARGLSIPAVSARLGHSRVSVTLDVYSHVVGGEDRQAADMIGEALAVAG